MGRVLTPLGPSVSQRWEHSPPTNWWNPGVNDICGLSFISLVLSGRFSPGAPFLPLLKNQHFQIAIRPGMVDGRTTRSICYLSICNYCYYYCYYYWGEGVPQVAKHDDTKNSRVWDLSFLSQTFVAKKKNHVFGKLDKGGLTLSSVFTKRESFLSFLIKEKLGN